MIGPNKGSDENLWWAFGKRERSIETSNKSGLTAGRRPFRCYRLNVELETGEALTFRVGYLSFDDKSADLLYEVINRRYERRSVILTTNRPFKEWNEVFPNAACIVTLLDRLLHHADVTKIEGDSYRVRESEQETAARRRKK